MPATPFSSNNVASDRAKPPYGAPLSPLGSGALGVWSAHAGYSTTVPCAGRRGAEAAGTLSGGWSRVSGAFGRCLHFDGTGQMSAQPAGSLTGDATWTPYVGTIVVWFRTTMTPNSHWCWIVGRAVTTQSASGADLILSPTGQIGFTCANSGGGVAAQIITTTTGYNDGNWHLLCAEFAQGNSKPQALYVDGVLAGTATSDTSNWFIQSDQPIRWGISQDTWWDTFVGEMEPGAWLPRWLTATEVASLWRSGPAAFYRRPLPASVLSAAVAASVFSAAGSNSVTLTPSATSVRTIPAAATNSLTLTPTTTSGVSRNSAATNSFTLTASSEAVHDYPVSAASSLTLTPSDSAVVAHTFAASAASSFTLTPSDSSGVAHHVAATTTLRFFPEPLAGFGWSVEGASSLILTPTDDASNIGPRRVSATTSITFTPEATEEYLHAVLADAHTSFTLTFADSGSRKTLILTPAAESTFTLTPAAGQNTDRHVAGASSLIFTPASSAVFEAAPPQSRSVSADDRPTLIFNQLASTVVLRHQFDELGRYRRGDKVVLGTSFPAIPDNPPIAVVLSLADSTIVGAYELAISDATRLDFALPVQVNLAYALGTYRVSYQFSVNGVPGTVRDAEFQVIPGGDSGGEVVSLHAFDRPESRYVVAQLNSGRLVQGRNPKVGDR